MPDALFADPRLARLYDALDGPRDDLDHYVAIAKELGARHVVDIGAGTGTLACLLAARGYDVIAVEPAEASLAIARNKEHAERVRWVRGDATALSNLDVSADAAFMTGNVAQVFLDDASWAETLVALHNALRPGGHIVFETRDPAQRAWTAWTRAATRTTTEIPGIGTVTSWVDVTAVEGDLVTFVWTFEFAASGETLTSTSTLRFRDRATVERSLVETGFRVIDVRDAPDRPGREFVFIASR